MIIAVDLELLADLALAVAERHPPRSQQRRVASHLWVSLRTGDRHTCTASGGSRPFVALACP